MKRQRLLFAAAAVGLVTLAVASVQITTSSPAYCAPDDKAARVLPQTSQSKKSFKEDVMPILVGRCISCHQSGGEGFAKSGLDLTSYAGVMKGTKFGPMVVPGDPESSNLMLLLDWRASPELRMPHGMKQLNSCDRNDIRAWIREGAKDN
ncbi:MAG: c-type cytochrome domain-containing protein [Pseudolabrys sp.]|jgi:mono/diheme cytochrome c family protein